VVYAVLGWIALKIKLWFIFKKASQEIAVENTSEEEELLVDNVSG
jgi:ABC-2 type transport system permease protein